MNKKGIKVLTTLFILPRNQDILPDQTLSRSARTPLRPQIGARKTTGPWISGRGAFQPLASVEQLTGEMRTTDPWISGRNLSASDLRSAEDRSEEDNRPLDLR